jgi:hypothetical protein
MRGRADNPARQRHEAGSPPQAGKEHRAMNMGTLVRLFENLDQLIQLRQKQADLMDDLRSAIVQQQMKESGMKVTPEGFVELVRLYSEKGPGSTITWQGHVLLRDYAKYLIEYLEPRMVAQQPSIAMQLRTIRKFVTLK